MPLIELLSRLVVATIAGMFLGVDREWRGMPAGLRTHGLVALSAAAITMSAVLMHESLKSGGATATDPLRVIQGLAQAIGFIAAGLIIKAKGSVWNVTSAADLWLATAVGIAAGAGQHMLVLATTGMGVLLLVGVRRLERLVPGHNPEFDD